MKGKTNTMKLQLPRDFYIPKDSREIKSADSTAVAYLGLSRSGSGKLVACGFSGKRTKPDFNYTFPDEARALAHIAQHAAGVRAAEARRVERRQQITRDRCATPLEVWNKAQAGKTLAPADVAVCLRATLARTFPGVKFSVRSDRSLNVSWTDGPSTKAVEAIAKCYSFEGFDGMIDMRYSISRWLSRDGSMSLAHTAGTGGSMGSDPEAIGSPHAPDAVQCKSYTDFVFCRREISPRVKMDLARQVCARHAIAMPDSFADDHAMERFLNTTTAGGDYLCAMVHRASQGITD